MCSHRPRLYHCTYFENIVIISYYIIHDILYRTRVHAAYSVFSHICQCPRDIQTHYNALYYFFPLLFPTRIRPMSYIAIQNNFQRVQKKKKTNNDDYNKKPRATKIYLVTVRGFLVSVSYLSQCTRTHEHHAERPYNNIFVIYDFFSLFQPRIRVCT